MAALEARFTLRERTSALCRNMLWGMMTAPTVPTACCTVCGGTCGMARPSAISPMCGPAMPHTVAKHTSMVNSSPANTASNLRTPMRSSSMRKKESTPVMSTPPHSGMTPCDSSEMAMDEPSSTWTSEPMMAISMASQVMKRRYHGYSSRQMRASCLPVTTPTRAARICRSHPSAVLHSRTQLCTRETGCTSVLKPNPS